MAQRHHLVIFGKEVSLWRLMFHVTMLDAYMKME